ncbi:MAG: F0F1 ATP synthase subunit delta, partial [Patescibacteria group bacterium]
NMKKVAPKHYAQALLRISGDSDANNVLDNFLSLIQKNGQLSKLGEILNEYERIALEKKEGIAADLSIAVSANRGKISELAKQIKIPGIEKFKITARDDKDLLGGFKLRVKDILIDASLKKKITDLKKNFN